MRAAFLAQLPRPVLAAALAAGLAVAAAACGTGGYVKGGDIAHGKQVFNTTYSIGHGLKYSCSTCHTLAAAGASGTIGPNLDNAFAADRDQKFAESTIQQVVADQIRIPLQGIKTAQGAVTPTGTPVMPANLVKGKDLTDVSAFVARCAANQNDPACVGAAAKITATSGSDVFKAAGCGNCHTLKAAGAHGTVGFNFDQLKPSESLVAKTVTNGKTGPLGTMPSFKTQLSPKQIQAVAKYVSSVAGK